MEFDAANSDDDADGRVGNVGKRESESEGENRAVDHCGSLGAAHRHREGQQETVGLLRVDRLAAAAATHGQHHLSLVCA